MITGEVGFKPTTVKAPRTSHVEFQTTPTKLPESNNNYNNVPEDLPANSKPEQSGDMPADLGPEPSGDDSGPEPSGDMPADLEPEPSGDMPADSEPTYDNDEPKQSSDPPAGSEPMNDNDEPVDLSAGFEPKNEEESEENPGGLAGTTSLVEHEGDPGVANDEDPSSI